MMETLMRSNINPPDPDKWKVGKYVDKDGQVALLGIYYTIGGELAHRPLTMRMSEADNAAKVRRALADAGADLEYLGDGTALNKHESARIVMVRAFAFIQPGDRGLIAPRQLGNSPRRSPGPRRRPYSGILPPPQPPSAPPSGALWAPLRPCERAWLQSPALRPMLSPQGRSAEQKVAGC